MTASIPRGSPNLKKVAKFFFAGAILPFLCLYYVSMSYTMAKDPLEIKPSQIEERLAFFEQLVKRQSVRIKELETVNAKLEVEIVKLRAQVKTDSSNSSQPPSHDGYKKPKPVSLRGKSARKPGGQPGHKGTTLQRAEHPDKIQKHAPETCCCGHDLRGVAGEVVASRQEHDLPPPPPKLEITEHQVVEVVCPHCGRRNRGYFPNDITGSVQYGPRLTANVIHVCYYELTPLERAVELFRELFGVKLSEGTIVNMLRKFSELVKDPVNKIWDMLVMSGLIHFDETGMRVNGGLRWVHLASTELLTYFFIHDKRGAEAIEAIGLLPLFKGKAVHDFWKPYFSFEDVIHCLCVAHLLRELKMAHEQ
jgi:transposase